MIITNPKDGTTFTLPDGFDFSRLEEYNRECKTDREYNSWLKNIDAPREYKAVLMELTKVTVTVGKVIFKVGKVVLNLLIEVIRQFPMTACGLLIGFVLGVIAAHIPLIGWILGPLIVPLFTLAGGVIGFLTDMSNKINNQSVVNQLQGMIQEKFSALNI